MELGLLLFFFFLTAAALALAAKTVRVMPQATVMVVERLGSFHTLADGGLHVLVPFLDKPRGVNRAGRRPGLSSIDLREQFLDFPGRARSRGTTCRREEVDGRLRIILDGATDKRGVKDALTGLYNRQT